LCSRGASSASRDARARCGDVYVPGKNASKPWDEKDSSRRELSVVDLRLVTNMPTFTRHLRGLAAPSLLISTCAVALVACSDASDPAATTVGTQDEPLASHESDLASIDEAGGSLEISTAQIAIPEGALSEDTDVEIRTLFEEELDELPLPPDGALDEPVAFLPHGTTFEEPVEVELALDPEREPLAVYKLEDENDPDWELVPGALFSGGKARFEVTSFSIYSVTYMELDAPPSSGTGGESSQGTGGLSGSGGSSPSSGGSSTATGGADAGTGGETATGGASSSTGGATASGGADAGSGGAASGGADGTGGDMGTGGSIIGSGGGASTGGVYSSAPLIHMTTNSFLGELSAEAVDGATADAGDSGNYTDCMLSDVPASSYPDGSSRLFYYLNQVEGNEPGSLAPQSAEGQRLVATVYVEGGPTIVEAHIQTPAGEDYCLNTSVFAGEETTLYMDYTAFTENCDGSGAVYDGAALESWTLDFPSSGTTNWTFAACLVDLYEGWKF